MRWLAFILLISANYTVGQNLEIKNLHYRNYFQSDSSVLSSSNHTSVKPYLQLKTVTESSRFSKSIKQNDLIYPIVNIGIGVDSETKFPFDLGVGLGIDYHSKKFTITGKLLPHFNQGGYVVDSIQQNYQINVGIGRPFGNDFFMQGELIAAYRPNKFFTFLGGIGKNSFGEGYRTLLLSDNAPANPFLKLETSFWSIKYVNLFNVWKDFSSAPQNRQKDVTKLSAAHYLSWNITKEFNFSVFETVVWEAKDTLTNRYFEPNYMNPFVMYRPVEYSQGSADNVLLGANLSFKTNSNTTIYSQVIVDEFLLAEIKDTNQWWGNKFGTQIGIKTKHFLIPNLYGQIEFNMVRPFTYSHKQSPQSYGHASASVTHPLGANFYEVNSILSYQLNRHQFTMQLTYAMFGADSSEVSYGQNVWKSYNNRDGDYNHSIGQGVQQNIFSANFFYEYPLKSMPNTFFTGRYQLRAHTSEKYFNQTHMLEIGIRSRIWNKNDDF
ncbi:MAG: hypothetical protein AB8B72_05890 [Crocinitomicaceae bacterium]